MARCHLLVCAILNTPSRSNLPLREGLRLIRGMRRALTEEEQHKIAGKMVGPPAEGHGQYLMPKLQGIGLVRSNSYLRNCVTSHTPQARIRDRSKMKRLQRRYLCQVATRKGAHVPQKAEAKSGRRRVRGLPWHRCDRDRESGGPRNQTATGLS
jgi:hypothetical protein